MARKTRVHVPATLPEAAMPLPWAAYERRAAIAVVLVAAWIGVVAGLVGSESWVEAAVAVLIPIPFWWLLGSPRTPIEAVGGGRRTTKDAADLYDALTACHAAAEAVRAAGIDDTGLRSGDARRLAAWARELYDDLCRQEMADADAREGAAVESRLRSLLRR